MIAVNGGAIVIADAAVIRPLPFTVNDPTCVALPKVPTFVFTVANVVADVPAVVEISPVNAGNCDAANEPVIELNAGVIVTLLAAVTRPFAFTVTTDACVAEP